MRVSVYWRWAVSSAYVLKPFSLRQVIRFPEAVEVALEELMPNRLTDYLYDLSDKFNSFYTECKVGCRWYYGRIASCCSILTYILLSSAM